MSISRRLISAALFLGACALFASLALFSAAVTATEDDSGDSVIIATDSTLDALTADADAIVKLHAPWCMICKRFESVFSTVANEWKTKNPELRFVSVDVDENRAIALRFLVNAVPSLFFVAANRSVRTIPLSLSANVVSQNVDAAVTGASGNWTSAMLNPFSLHMRAFGKMVSSVSFIVRFYEDNVLHYSLPLLGGAVTLTGTQLSLAGLAIVTVLFFLSMLLGSQRRCAAPAQTQAQPVKESVVEEAVADAATASAVPKKATRARRTKTPDVDANGVEKAPRRSTRRRAGAAEE